MQTLILILHVVLCIFLIIVVLLQPGKGGDAGIAFGGGGGSQSVFGARGATTFLQKLTTYAAVLFMVTTITLAWYSSESLSRKSVISEDVLKDLQTETTTAPGAETAGDEAPVKPEATSGDESSGGPQAGQPAAGQENAGAGAPETGAASGAPAGSSGASGSREPKTE